MIFHQMYKVCILAYEGAMHNKVIFSSQDLHMNDVAAVLEVNESLRALRLGGISGVGSVITDNDLGSLPAALRRIELLRN